MTISGLKSSLAIKMEDLVVYEKSTCTKCRAAEHLLDASGKPYRRVRYHEEPLSVEKLRDLARKLQMRPVDLLRTDEPLYKELGLKGKDISDEEVLTLLSQHPDLLQRPILECGERAVLGRPTQRITAFLQEVSGQ